MIRISSLILAAILSFPAIGHAEGELDREQFALHLNFGMEGMGGDDMATFVARTHLGVSKAFGTMRVRPSVGMGVTMGGGLLSVSDPRALSGTLDLSYLDYGPELQLGMRWGNGGFVDNRLFASFAYLRTNLDTRLMIDSVEGVGGNRGMRASIGVSWADAAGRMAASTETRYDNAGHRTENVDWLILLLPQQVELGWERSAGSDRIGLTLSYGI